VEATATGRCASERCAPSADSRGRPDRHEPQRRDRRLDASGRERSASPIVYGARCASPNGARVKPGDAGRVGPFANPILPEVGGNGEVRRHRRGIHHARSSSTRSPACREGDHRVEGPELRPRISIKAPEQHDDCPADAGTAAGRRATSRDRGAGGEPPARSRQDARARPRRRRTSRAVCRAWPSSSRRASRRTSRSSPRSTGVVASAATPRASASVIVTPDVRTPNQGVS
jgi:hypothetical protein